MVKQVTLNTLYDAIRSMRQEIHEIKEAVVDDEEGELTDWAKKELAKAMAEPEESYTAHDEVKKNVLEK